VQELHLHLRKSGPAYNDNYHDIIPRRGTVVKNKTKKCDDLSFAVFNELVIHRAETIDVTQNAAVVVRLILESIQYHGGGRGDGGGGPGLRDTSDRILLQRVDVSDRLTNGLRG